MATATRKAHATAGVSEPASLAFRTYRDNGEHYHWEIIDSDGAVIAQSGNFASQDDAERAAREVHERARCAPFESQVAEERHTVVA
ncbi:MAG: DUF1508 domain-containing protein [Solirubrobacteraceae bacterium]